MSLILNRLAFLALIYMPLNAHAGAFDGDWAGLWRHQGRAAVAVAMTITNDAVTAYIWDGKDVAISGSTRDGTALVVTGPKLRIRLEKRSPAGLRATSVRGGWVAQLSPTPRRYDRRPPVFSSRYFGAVPDVRAADLRLSARYLDMKCCFGRYPRDAPHAGMDFNGRRHATAIAAADGRVTRFYSAFNNYGCGNGLTLRHANGLFSSYCHLESVADLKIGARLKRGDVIGTVGSTGISPRGMTHVHFELTRDGDPHVDGDVAQTIDPKGYFAGCFGAPDRPDGGFYLTYPIKCANPRQRLWREGG